MCCWALETWPQAIPRAACLAGKNFSNFSQANTASGPSPKNRGSGIHAKNLEDWGGTWKNKTTSKQRGGACGLCHLPWYHGSKHVCSDLIKLVDGADPCWLADRYLATVSQERHKLFKAAQIIRPVDKWQQGEKGDVYTQPLHTGKGRKGPSKTRGTTVLPWWETNSSIQPSATEIVPENREQEKRDIL